MEKLKLKLNRIVFWWYYRLVDDHFKQYPIIKSIKLLRQHYEHEAAYTKALNKVISDNIGEVEFYKKQYFDLKMQVTQSPGTIDVLNRAFGADINPPDTN